MELRKVESEGGVSLGSSGEGREEEARGREVG